MTAAASDSRASLATRAALASVAAAIILIGLKTYASWQTGSVAMLGSLADSGLDLIASLVTLAGVRIAAAPADHDHRFGHGKAEALVALAQVALITVSAVGIAWRSIDRLMGGETTADAGIGIGVSIAAIVTTLALTRYQAHVVRRTGSVAIATDKVHYQSDLFLNAAVILALVLEQHLAIHGADAVTGIAIAAWLAWGAFRASQVAVHQLMDREWPDEDRDAFLTAAADYPLLKGLHDFRTRNSGVWRFAQFHVWVPAEWTVREAHDRIDEIEEALQARFPNTEFIIHLDPEGHTDRETMLSSDITEGRS